MISKPKFKIGRRLGAGVYDKCQTSKFKNVTNFKKFSHNKTASEFSNQLIEKQKVRFSYGITERQLYNYVKKASKIKGAGTALRLYEDLENRLDNIIYRMGIAPSRRAARQMVSHGHFIIHNHKITVPSYSVNVGDIIKIRDESKNKKIFSGLENKMKDKKEFKIPSWLSFDVSKLEGKILGKPEKLDNFLDLEVVLEFYSK